jgi:hypothetical protein
MILGAPENVTEAASTRPGGHDVHSGLGRAAEPNTKRAMVLYALGALIGLGAAGYELLTAQGTVTRSVPAEDLALINQQPILRSDFVTQLESETGLPFEKTSRQEKLRVLDEMVDEELKVQRGLELNFAETDQDTRNTLATVVNHQMIAEVVTSQPTEKDLVGYFEAHRAQYHSPGAMTVCDLALPKASLDVAAQAQRAASAAASLRAGTPLQQVQKRYELANANSCENNFYFAIKIHLSDKLFAVAQGLATGAVSDPVQMPDGVHILQIVSNLAPAPESYSDARDRVEGDYKDDHEARVRAGTMSFLRHRANIMIAGDYADYQIYGSRP